MALVLKDRVKQTAAAPGTGTITLSGSATGFQSFSVIGNGNTTYFAVYDPVSGDWEVSYGTYTSSGTTLTRNATPLSSSAGGSLVNFTGVVDVFVTYPSENAVWRDTSGVVVQQDFGAITATSAALTTGTISTAPVNNTDIVNKQYADAIASGIHFHEAVDLATTAALPANTYNNGTSGVGATLTANANGALSVDSTLTVAANRILVKNEAAGANNGVYVVTQVGSAGTPYILTRATDFDSAGTGVDQIDEGDFFLVTSGVVNLNTAWVQQTAPPIVVGTTALVFQQFAAPITYTAGTGLNESPTYTFNIATTGVSAATYGSASTSATIAVNAQGQITSASNTTIAINGTQVSGNIAGQAGSVANALTAGTYLTSGGTYDGSAARTFAVDATDANTASKVVARDSSGNFSAGTITATLSGAATSAGTATNIAGGAANQIPYQTGAATTSFVVAPTVAGTYLNWNGSSFAYTAISLPNNATFNNGGAGDASGTTFNGSAARTISYNTVGASPLAGSSSLTTTGTVTSGTWSASFGAVSGANLTSLTAANISGTVALANGGTASSTAGGARTSLGATTLGSNLFTITNPSAVTFPRFNADNTVSSLDAATFRSAIGAGTSSTTGTVTSITAGTYLTGGTITTSGTLAVDATTTNTASKVVARDASGNFSAGTITATLSGNASTATSATTAGTITSQANSATITATSANTASQIVLRDASGNFSAGTITATLSGNATNVTGTVAVANGGTGQTTGYKLFEATYTSSIDANVNRTAGMYGSYAAAATNTPTTSGILYHFLSGTGGAGDGGQFWQDYVTNNLYLRQRWGGTYGSWLTILSASNYNSYAPALTGTGASGTWGISITGNSATVGGFTPSASSGVGSRVVVADSNGYIFNNYFNSTDNAITSGITAMMSKQGDNYYRSASAAAVATFIGGQTFSATTVANNSGSVGNATPLRLQHPGGGAYATSSSSVTGAIKIRMPFLVPAYGMWKLVVRIYEYGNRGNGYTIELGCHMYPNYAYNRYQWMLTTSTGGVLPVRYGNDGTYSCIWIGDNATTWLYPQIFISEFDNGYNNTSASSWQTGWVISIGTIDNSGAVDGPYTTDLIASSVCTGNAATITSQANSATITAATAATANQIVLRDGSGHINAVYGFFQYLNMSHGASGSTTDTVFYSSGDDYIRKNNGTGFRASLNVPTRTGGDASGNWNIGISGTAALANRASTYFYIDQNYGYSVVGLYASTIFQGLYAMGDAYKTGAGGTISNLYGMTWSYPSAGGIAGNLSSHGVIVAINGGFGSCMSYNVTASANVTAYSDERLKRNWEPLCDNFVEKLADVKVGTYERIDQPIVQVGVSAQSLEKVIPEAVSTATDDMQTKHVSYGNAALASAVMLAKELVELKQMMKQMQEEIAELKRGV
jgi:hypothetical protein